MKFKSVLMALLFAGQINAQVSVEEPEFVGEVILLQSDNEGIKLTPERCKYKAKSSKLAKIASLAPVPGASLAGAALGKSKINVELKGDTAAVWVMPGTVRLVIRAEKQDYDPRTYLRIVKFNQEKRKRSAELISTSFMKGTELNSDSEKFEIEKYGGKSFLVTLKNVKPGQYGITTTELVEVKTFGVK